MVASFKRVAVDQSSEHWESINLKEYLDSTILSLHPKIKHRKVKIANCCPDEIVLYTNPGAIYQVMSNLILNSLFHAFNDDEQGSISIEAKLDNEYVVIDYKDNGRGMTAEVQSKAFDPFFTTRRGQGGSGLGLHLVYNLVTSGLDGNITLASSAETGTHFHIDLPVKKSAAG
jgi:signal transduction histidine kinase